MDAESKEKLASYTERHRFWNTQVLTQFGYTINLFTTVGIGLFGFLISKREDYSKIIIDNSLPIDWSLVCYFSTLVLLFISICSGIVSIMSRLYDLRLTKHLIWTRKKVFKVLNRMLPDGFIDLRKVSTFRVFCKIISGNIEFTADIENDDFGEIKEQFEKLRRQSKILGRISWRAHRIQFYALILSVVVYGLTIF